MTGSLERYDSLMAAADRTIRAGDMRAALAQADAAAGEARRHGRPDLLEHAVCLRWSVAVELGEARGVEIELMRILRRRPSSRTARLAAAVLARAHRQAGRLAHAVRYMALASHHAERTGDVVRLAETYFNEGVYLIAANRPAEGDARITAALECDRAEQGQFQGALALSVRAYCAALQGRRAAALERIAEAARQGGRCAVPYHESSARLNLGYALLELGQPDAAEDEGRKALAALAGLDHADPHDRKHALFLLAEAAAELGRGDEAFDLYSRLQREHYPGQPGLAHLLLALSTHRCHNWLA